MGKFLKVCKGYIVSAVIFMCLTVILAAILSITDMPMKNADIFMIAALTLSAMFFGFLVGHAMKKRGLIVGIGSGFIYVMTIVFVITTALGCEFASEIVSIVYIIPIILSGISGAVGTNLKS